MGSKYFISYKHSDSSVQRLQGGENGTARDYVDCISSDLLPGHIDKSEAADEDISDLSEEEIEDHLFDKLYDSSVTIVLISKNMKEDLAEKNQWIPREISYSLREVTRGDKTSRRNAMLGVVIPDESGGVDYLVTHSNCPHCKSRTWQSGSLFKMLGENMFNRKNPKTYLCDSHQPSSKNIHTGHDHSYIYPVLWEEFRAYPEGCIETAKDIRERKEEYNIMVKIPD